MPLYLLFRPLGITFLLTFALALGGCESVTGDLSSEASLAPAAINPSAELLLPLVLPPPSRGVPPSSLEDVRDGARLALEDLGEGMVGLQLTQTGRQPGEALAAYRAAASNGAPLALGWLSEQEAAALPQDGGLAVVGLASTGAGRKGVFYNLRSSEASFLAAALEPVLAAGRKNALLVLPQGTPAPALLARRIAVKGGAVVATVEYPAAAGAARAALEGASGSFAQADVFIIAGDGAGRIVDILADLDPALMQKAIVATPAVLATPPKLQHPGLVVATLDPDARAAMAERFTARFGRPASDDAAYGYDLVAVAIGLTRQNGDERVPAASITNSAGFKGATGVFRLQEDGSAERLLRVGVVKGGSFAPIDEAPTGF